MPPTFRRSQRDAFCWTGVSSVHFDPLLLPPSYKAVLLDDAATDAAITAASTTPPLADLIDPEDLLLASDEEDAEKLAKKACRK